MSFLDDLISTTKTVAASAGKKTDEAVKLSKLKIRKAQIRSDIKSKNEKLGAMIYQMAKANEKDNDAFDAAIAEIDVLYAKLAEVNKLLDELSGFVTCTKCSAKTKNDNSYCPKCGTKLPVSAPPAAEADGNKSEEDEKSE